MVNPFSEYYRFSKAGWSDEPYVEEHCHRKDRMWVQHNVYSNRQTYIVIPVSFSDDMKRIPASFQMKIEGMLKMCGLRNIDDFSTM
ncbi:hypothetical protein TNCV_1320541 [Trichonephila clavipes]|nr:hypothetical protein TNCV_1320541 [Trichonephila clavipes]